MLTSSKGDNFVISSIFYWIRYSQDLDTIFVVCGIDQVYNLFSF